MKWLLARVGLTTDRVHAPQTLAAANRRHREALAEAGAGIAAAAALEAALPPSPENAALRRERVGLEAALERMRMRVEIFRSEKVAGGVVMVNARSESSVGDSLAALHAQTSDLVRAVAELNERLAALGGSDDLTVRRP